MFQLSGIAAQWRAWEAAHHQPGGLKRRVLGMGAALLIEALLLLVLLTLNGVNAPTKREVVVDITAHDVDEPPPPRPAASAKPPPGPPALVPPPPSTAEPVPQPSAVPQPVPVIVLPRPFTLPPAPGTRPSPAPPANQPAYGPPDTGGGGGSAYGDSERVGTAPNGEAMYAATWYMKPTDSQLRGYLSTADGPGWALITCKTVPDYRVEDCVGLGEYPEGSGMLRAVLAAAWQFRVRPPRRGGQAMVGAWVRIRIDYELRPARGSGDR